jgi:hypothetical protein
MKKQIFATLILIFLMSNFLYSQDTTKVKKSTNPTEKKHELRICFYNPGSKNTMNNFLEWIYFWDYYLDDYYPYSYISGNNSTNYGIGYSFTFGKNALRTNIGFNYNNENSNYKHTYSSTHVEDMNTSIFSYCMSLGYQRNFNFDRCKLYLGLDGKFGINNYNSKFKYIYTTIPATVDESYKTSSYEIGGGPLIGLQYYILPNLSLSVETCINAMYVDYKTTYVFSDYTSPTETNTSTSNRFNINIKPLSIISANIHL